MKRLTDWNCHLLPMMGEWITNAADSLRALRLLHARTGITRFYMTAQFDCQQEALSCFLLQRDRAVRELVRLLPPHLRISAGAYARLRPELSEISGLRKLCIPSTDLLPIQLPWNAETQESALALNRLLYHTNVRPLFMEFDHLAVAYPQETVNRLLQLDGVAYQFNLLSLGSPRLRQILCQLSKRHAPILFGTAVNSPGAAAYYDFQSAMANATAAWGKEPLEELLAGCPSRFK